jgi:tetratricopeptide (TPR) repeat protein
MLKIPGYAEPVRRASDARQQVFERAMFAFQMQRFGEAEQIANEALKANRNAPWALQLLGQALMMQGRNAEAVAPLEKAARRSEDPAIETQLAVALQAAGRRDEAVERLRRTTLRKPPFAPAFAELSQQLFARGSPDEAIAVIERGLALLPGDPDLSLQFGSILAARNERARSRALFAQAVAKQPERLDALHALAHALRGDGDHAAAADLFRRVLRIRPDDAAARVALGMCLLELREAPAAVDTLRAAMRGGPQMFGQGLAALASSARGRFWLRPSRAAKFLRGEV